MNIRMYGCVFQDFMTDIVADIQWADCIVLATHGYAGKYATDPFEMGIKRLCIHSGLKYIGLYSVRDEGNLASFKTQEAMDGARDLAGMILNA